MSELDFEAGALERYLAEHVDGFAGPVEYTRFKGGQSNPTYRLDTPVGRYVLRKKPNGKLLPKAHMVDREYRVMTGLWDTAVPVPRTRLLCEDDAVIGTDFYLMDFVDGRVLWDPQLPELDAAERAGVYAEMNRVMAALHSVDYDAAGLGDFGRPEGYVERQIALWTKQYRASETEHIEAMEQLIDWLPANLPASSESAIAHGDFRLDNMIFDAREPKVLAVLDWELCTLGHPLADFAYHMMVWRLSPSLFRGLGGVDVESLGIPVESDYLRQYCDRTGRDMVGRQEWNFYIAYNMFRLAAILQGIAKRAIDGTAASPEAVENGKRARPLAEEAWRQAQRA
jgi:aminoglycoside phosphotransferase (APT) family kinase protein